ncbi:elongation factor P [PVC group bacterium]|nr:elongation factor P [PVC group bacterium]
MYNASDLRKGLKIEIDGQPWVITDFQFKKPGKGQSIYNCKLKNMITGTTMSKSYRSNDKMNKPALSQATLLYSYQEGNNYIFMDDNYEQITIGPDVLGNSRFFLSEDVSVEVLMFNGAPIEVELPNFVEREIVHTEPGARGNTATNVLKPATVEGGYEVNVPIFINQGDLIRIDTRTGEYAERVNS